MRKIRDIDGEIKALQERARDLKARKTVQFGVLVEATGADAIPLEALAGVLLAAAEQAKDKPEAVARWAERGRAFFLKDGANPAARSKRASGRKSEPNGHETAGSSSGSSGDPESGSAPGEDHRPLR